MEKNWRYISLDIPYGVIIKLQKSSSLKPSISKGLLSTFFPGFRLLCRIYEFLHGDPVRFGAWAKDRRTGFQLPEELRWIVCTSKL